MICLGYKLTFPLQSNVSLCQDHFELTDVTFYQKELISNLSTQLGAWAPPVNKQEALYNIYMTRRQKEKFSHCFSYFLS